MKLFWFCILGLGVSGIAGYGGLTLAAQPSVVPVVAVSSSPFKDVSSVSAEASTSKQHKIRIADFDADPFGYDFTIDHFQHRYAGKFKLRKEFHVNEHDPAVVDTIFHFNYSSCQLSFYKGGDEEFLYAARISGSDIALRNDIKVGMSRDAFLGCFSELQSRPLQGTIMISDPEMMTSYRLVMMPQLITIVNDSETAKYSFVFQDNKLHQILISLYLD
jgi:hypothetical protein